MFDCFGECAPSIGSPDLALGMMGTRLAPSFTDTTAALSAPRC